MGEEDVASLTVGVAPGAPPIAGRSAIVGAGAGGRGAPPAIGALGGTGGAIATDGVGGRTGGALGTVATGDAGGASAALRVTRTVSFFKGTLDVCFDGGWD
jgi:hypothetical protein